MRQHEGILPMVVMAAITMSAVEGGEQVQDPKQHLERTSFQTGGYFHPKVDIQSDVAMVYGIDAKVADRIKNWKENGYIIHVMTGVAWGSYQDYFRGDWDGKSHEDEAQTDRNGNPILHGPTVPYVAPSETYGKYLCVGVKRAIDAGAEAIHLEEPEFWVHGGYSGSFKREWQAYYSEPWIPPHSTPDAQYRASKLKYYLYRRALQQVFDFIIDYGKQTGRKVRCYVPTHSMINYAHWRIVSPEQSLVLLKGCDGYIGQVWTGTARTPNVYQGVLKERTFETAFFEYGVLHNLVRSTGRRMYYLNDPVEDNPEHSWDDYRKNWECTLVASLLWPDVWYYEVSPWPERPFRFQYPVKDITQRKEGEEAERVGISSEYATELLTVFSALNDMKQSRVRWDCGTQGIGILVSDTMMFQRGDPNPSDPHLGSFYGLALPLVKRGIPVHPVQIENAGLKGYLKPYKVLLLTYEGMKPPSPELHRHFADWVQAGGVLVFIDDDSDPYNAVTEWWNSNGLNYPAPRVHLFKQMGLGEETGEGTYQIGEGALIYSRVSPRSLTKDKAGADTTISLTRQACPKAGIQWKETSYLLLRRGPYMVAAGLDETGSPDEKQLKGRFINLFDPKVKVLQAVSLKPGDRLFLMDLDKIDLSKPCVIASASKVLEAKATGSTLRFHSEGPAETIAATRLSLPAPPKSVRVGNYADNKIQSTWDPASKTLLMEYPNSPEGVWVEVKF